MARLQHIGESQGWFIGEDKQLKFEIYAADEATMEDVSAFSLMWVLTRSMEGNDVVISRSTGGSGVTVTGVYNADPDTNTQRVVVTIGDDLTDDLDPGVYHHALWRTDAGSETVLSYGTVHLQRAAR